MAVVTKKIANLPASTSVAATDVFVKETNGGVTQKITGENLVYAIGTLRPGAQDLEYGIYSGYITGSGNYVDVFIPCMICTSVTSITITSTGTMALFGVSGRVTLDGITPTVLGLWRNGLALEFTLPSTYTPVNSAASVLIYNLKMTCA